MARGLNPEATPWSPIILNSTNILYNPQPLFSTAKIYYYYYYYDQQLLLSSSTPFPPPPPPLWVPHHHHPIPLYNNIINTTTNAYYSLPPQHAHMQTIPSDAQHHHHHHHHKGIFSTSSSSYYYYGNGKKRQSRNRFTRFTASTNNNVIKTTWKIKGHKPHNNNDHHHHAQIITNYIPQQLPILADNNKNTCVMIRNIPNNFRRGELLAFLDLYCIRHQLKYDFFYLPMDFMTDQNYGYAFANFTTSTAASKIMSLLNGHKWASNFNSRKICQVTWARIQGKEELVRNFQQSKFCCDDAEYLPVVFCPPRDGSTSVPMPSTIGDLEKKSTATFEDGQASTFLRPRKMVG